LNYKVNNYFVFILLNPVLMQWRFHQGNFIIAILIFVVEVSIALFMHDAFIRPYVGDYLVVFLIYYTVSSFIETHPWKIAVFTLLFAYMVEWLQYFKFVERVGLGENALARTVIGVGFEWKDMVAYTLGVMTIFCIEHFRNTL
jgi:Protein of unknown function (DUF2809)